MTLPKRKTLIPLFAAIALVSAFTWKHYQDVNRYVSNGKFPDITVLMRAAYEGDLAEVQSLLDRGADITLTDGFGHTALYSAIRGGNHDIVKLLLDAGADINDHYPIGYDDSRFCTLLAAIPFVSSDPGDPELFSNLANHTPHDTSSHFCQIIYIATNRQPKYLEPYLSSLDPTSAAWEASRARSIYRNRTTGLTEISPEMQKLNDILIKYE